MDPISILSQLGLGVASNAIFDFLKSRLLSPTPGPQLQAELQNIIDLNGVQMRAETVIEALARNGVIRIVNSSMHANESLSIGAQGGLAIWGDNSVASTDKTAIVAGSGATIRATGNAKVVQHPDGSNYHHLVQTLGQSIGINQSLKPILILML